MGIFRSNSTEISLSVPDLLRSPSASRMSRSVSRQTSAAGPDFVEPAIKDQLLGGFYGT
jgi:hypothetical protein